MESDGERRGGYDAVACEDGESGKRELHCECRMRTGDTETSDLGIPLRIRKVPHLGRKLATELDDRGCTAWTSDTCRGVEVVGGIPIRPHVKEALAGVVRQSKMKTAVFEMKTSASKSVSARSLLFCHQKILCQCHVDSHFSDPTACERLDYVHSPLFLSDPGMELSNLR